MPFFVCYLFIDFQSDAIEQHNINFMVIASKKVGNSVKRSRAKRLLRAIVSQSTDLLIGKHIKHCIFIARSSIVEKKSTELVKLLMEKL